MKTEIILTFYNSFTDESWQEIHTYYLDYELNEYTLQEFAEHLNDWTICDNDLCKMSFCFECTLQESKKYKLTKDLHLNNGKVYFEYNKTTNELILS